MFVVINMQDEDDGGGTHWVSCFLKNGDLFYFDSYGIVPPQNVIKWMKEVSNNIYYNTSQIQSLTSTACGFYVLYFIQEIIEGRSFFDFVSQFYDSEGDRNEHILFSKLNIVD